MGPRYGYVFCKVEFTVTLILFPSASSAPGLWGGSYVPGDGLEFVARLRLCLQTGQDSAQTVVGLFAVLRVERVPHGDGTALARLYRLHAVVIARVEADHASTSRHHRRL